jgi:enamine deaminase RidA (YjgF/YER057c/UK114 family)
VSIERYGSGGPWEASIGYSRVVVAGPFAITAGTTATVDGQVEPVGDPHGQTRVALRIALDALAKAGAAPEQVIRTRMYVTDIAHLGEVGRAHGEVFGEIRPVATMVAVAALAHPDHLVEVEVEAYVGDS